MQISLFSSEEPSAPAAALPEARESPFVEERPSDLVEADASSWAELAARPGWAAMMRIPSMAPHVAELGLAVAYTERRLLARGVEATAARLITGPQLMVDGLQGVSPWPLAAAILAGG